MRVPRSLLTAGVIAMVGVAVGIRGIALIGSQVSGDGISGLIGVSDVRAGHVNPVGVPDMYATTMGTVLNVPVPGVLVNDLPAHLLMTLEADLQDGARYGTVVLSLNGSFTYTPPSNWAGSDRFVYCAADAGRCSGPRQWKAPSRCPGWAGLGFHTLRQQCRPTPCRRRTGPESRSRCRCKPRSRRCRRRDCSAM